MHAGRYTCGVIDAGTFALDGGAMFGIVPRPLWEKAHAPDAKNRIRLAANCLLLRDGARTILVDNGMGSLWSEKDRGIFCVEEGALDRSLAAHGISRDDVTDLLLTHLHFDHAGGTVARDASGELALAFQNARIHVGERHHDWSKAPTARDKGSFKAEVLSLLERDGRLVRHAGSPGDEITLFDDVRAVICDGHTTGQLVPIVGRGKDAIVFPADMIPTAAHARLSWIMAYDLRPLVILDEKHALLSRVHAEGMTICFEHDVGVPLATLDKVGEDFRAVARTPIEVA